MQLWYPAFVYFTRRLGMRLQKIVLDRPGASCPNRDAAAGRSGCVFCNPYGSGSGLAEAAPDIAVQWEHWRMHYGAKARLFMAYFQSFTNTCGPVEEVRELVALAEKLPAVAGIAVGTRPDCVDEAKLDAIAACGLPEVWLELGLQSAHDATLIRIRRGHDVAASERAVRLAAGRGIKVCGHLMAGLPGEGPEDFLDSIRWAAALPLAGIKLHNVYVARGTPLERDYLAGAYLPPGQREYVALAAEALALLPARMVIQRLVSDPAPDELVAPDWVRLKSRTHDAIRMRLAARKEWQGCRNDARDGIPAWFSLRG
ncbi:MAG: TIGR01212 family radical SAM protein [Deltaproteobacteria bacterium]|jgi:radical SAM protein (TIGR01212 family)|nr:TIGR01212 family radical SAM protein [Deltaproteobacteria bacterium]